MIFVNKKKPQVKKPAAFHKTVQNDYFAALIAACAAARRAIGILNGEQLT